MTKINLKDFYPWYTHDEYVETPDEIVKELLTNERQERAQKRRIYRSILLTWAPTWKSMPLLCGNITP